MVRYIQGDIFRYPHLYDVIIHGCNCFCNMGAGIAREIKKRFPAVASADSRTISGNRQKLGTIQPVVVSSELTVVNAYTQYHYGKNKLHCSYGAIKSCMELAKELFSPEEVIAMPKIGCGLAGGNWSKVEAILIDVFNDREVLVFVY